MQTGTFSSVAYSPDGKELASFSDNHFLLWDSGTWAIKNAWYYIGYSLAYSPDGTEFASGLNKGICLYDRLAFGLQLGRGYLLKIYGKIIFDPHVPLDEQELLKLVYQYKKDDQSMLNAIKEIVKDMPHLKNIAVAYCEKNGVKLPDSSLELKNEDMGIEDAE